MTSCHLKDAYLKWDLTFSTIRPSTSGVCGVESVFVNREINILKNNLKHKL